MTDIVFPPITGQPGTCADCKHIAPQLRRYGKVLICHACTLSRRRVARGDEPQTRRPKHEYEKPVRNRRCTDCQAREPDGRHWGDAYLCLTCENDMLERIDHPPYTVEHDRISA